MNSIYDFISILSLMIRRNIKQLLLIFLSLPLFFFPLLFLSLGFTPVKAQENEKEVKGLRSNEEEDALDQCLKAWGKTPFTRNSKYKTIATSVRVFGIGSQPKDSEKTESPSLVLVNPVINVMGGATYELSNPNGWYCFRANVNVMGGLILKVHCKAHLAFGGSAVSVMGSNASDGKGVTVMGNTEVKSIGCD